MGYSGILGYGILEFILGYELNLFWDMGYIGQFILGYGILPTPLTKPHYVEQLRCKLWGAKRGQGKKVYLNSRF